MSFKDLQISVKNWNLTRDRRSQEINGSTSESEFQMHKTPSASIVRIPDRTEELKISTLFLTTRIEPYPTIGKK